MRKVFANAMVAHVWAQQSQTEGRSNNGQLYFVGDTIFSYGSHYPVARMTDARVGGSRVVLFNCERSSKTTEGKHKNAVRRALHGLDVRMFYVPMVRLHSRFGHADADAAHAINLEHLAACFREHAERMAKPHVAAWLGYVGDDRIEDTDDNRVASLAPLVMEIHQYADAFNVTARPHVELDQWVQKIRDAWSRFHDPKAVAKRDRAKARAKAKRDAAHAALFARAYAFIEGVAPRLSYHDTDALRSADHALHRTYVEAVYRADPPRETRPTVTVDQWRDGRGSMTALGYSHATALRRVGDRLETSRGAEVPWQHAVAAFFKAQRCRRDAKAWHRNGEQVRVGHFQVDAIDPTGNLRAGCHTLDWNEMERLAVREIPDAVRPTYPLPMVV